MGVPRHLAVLVLVGATLISTACESQSVVAPPDPSLSSAATVTKAEVPLGFIGACTWGFVAGTYDALIVERTSTDDAGNVSRFRHVSVMSGRFFDEDGNSYVFSFNGKFIRVDYLVGSPAVSETETYRIIGGARGNFFFNITLTIEPNGPATSTAVATCRGPQN